MSEKPTEPLKSGDPEVEALIKLLNEQGGLDNGPSFGDAVVRALRNQLATLDPVRTDPFVLNRLLENPMVARCMAVLLLGLNQPFRVSVRVPGYAWLPYVTNKVRVLVDASRRKYERFVLSHVPKAQRLTGRRKTVRLTFVCAMKPVTAEEAVAFIRSRGLRPAHPIEGLQLADKRPDLLCRSVPITILGRSLRLRQWPVLKGMTARQRRQQKRRQRREPLPVYYLTLWRNKDGLTTYLEPTKDRVYPAYALFLAAEL